MDEREKKLEEPEPPKQPKQEHIFALGAEVALFPNTGVDKLGRVVKIASQLLTVKWGDGTIEQFSRTGHSFYGRVNSVGEPAKPLPDEEKMWGTEEDPRLVLPDRARETTLSRETKSSD